MFDDTVSGEKGVTFWETNLMTQCRMSNFLGDKFDDTVSGE